MVFAYRALGTGGQPSSGVVAADSARQAWETLRARGVYPVELHASDTGAVRRASRGARRELPGLFAQLATLVDGGLPVDEALAAALDSGTFPALAPALTNIGASVTGGDGLAEALSRFPDLFSPADVALVCAGETSGRLDEALARLAADHERRAERRGRVTSALIYPAVTATTAVAVLAFLTIWVLPQMAELFEQTGAPVPPATRLLLGAAAAFRSAWWVALGGLGAALIAGRRLWRHEASRRRTERLLHRMPVVGRLRRDAAVAGVNRTLGLLLQGGVPLDEAIGLAAPAARDAAVREAVRRAREAVRRGDGLTTVLGRERLLTPGSVRVLAAGERTGRLADALERAATLQEADVLRRLDRLAVLLEPATVLVMGGAVLAVVATVLLPLLSLEP